MSEPSTGLSRTCPTQAKRITSFLNAHAAHNAYLLGQIARGALTSDHIAGPMIGYWNDGRLEGIACCGSNFVVSSPCSEAAIKAFAAYAREGKYVIRVAVGEDVLLDQFMTVYGRSYRPISIERAGQQLFSLQRGDLKNHPAEHQIRPADITELADMMEIDRRMIIEELGVDPFSEYKSLFREGWIRRIREARSWIVRPEDREVLFKVDQSAVSSEVIQIAGVYTTPGGRRQGIAAGALSQLCTLLLEEAPLITLYVHGQNVAAIALYQALGFQASGRVRSVWFDI